MKTGLVVFVVLMLMLILGTSGGIYAMCANQSAGRAIAQKILKCSKKSEVDQVLSGWMQQDRTEETCALTVSIEKTCSTVAWRYTKGELSMDVYFRPDLSFHSLKGTGWPD